MPENVAILPYQKKLGTHPGRIALDDLMWPLGKPAGTQGQCLADLGREDHLIVFPRTSMHLRPSFGTRAQVSMMVLEPAAIHGNHLKMLRQSWRRFFRVLTCYEPLLQHIPNGIFFPFGSTWVPEWRDVSVEKTQMASLIASAKRSQEGHRLRHEVVEWAQAGPVPLDVMGMGYKPFAHKSEGLAPYRYSVVIENVRERNYFTEKLVDALLCQCVPIYWGCPNIGDFFDTAGMIICNSGDDIRAALRAMSKQDFAARLPALAAMRARADHFGRFEERAARAVLDSL